MASYNYLDQNQQLFCLFNGLFDDSDDNTKSELSTKYDNKIVFWKMNPTFNDEGQKQPLEVFYRKGVLKNFAKFTGKHLFRSLFFDKFAGLKPTQVCSWEFGEIFKNIFLLQHASEWLFLPRMINILTKMLQILRHKKNFCLTKRICTT